MPSMLRRMLRRTGGRGPTPATIPDAGPTFDDHRFAPPVPRDLPSFAALEALLRDRYHTDRLVSQQPSVFSARLQEYLELVDYSMEGLSSAEGQRDLTIKFHWGHDTDFGTFALPGRMGQNHIRAVSTFVDHFQALPRDLRGVRILDIGVWTGGTTLLLAAMGAEVVAVEEVKKYCDCLDYVCASFGLRNVTVKPVSLYDCTGTEFDDRFDFVLFPGVLYHLSDPVIALRILFNSLRDGGRLLLQSKAIASTQSICHYEGAGIFRGGSREELSRKGWNWFFPSPPAVATMLHDVGFQRVTVTRARHAALAAVATRHSHVEITRAGLSMRHIR